MGTKPKGDNIIWRFFVQDQLQLNGFAVKRHSIDNLITLNGDCNEKQNEMGIHGSDDLYHDV